MIIRGVISYDPGVGRFRIIRPGAPRVYLYHVLGLRTVAHHPLCFRVVIGWRMRPTPPSSRQRLQQLRFILHYTRFRLVGIVWRTRNLRGSSVEDTPPETPPG